MIPRNDSRNSHRAGMAAHLPFVGLLGGQPKRIFWVYPRIGICSARGLRVRTGMILVVSYARTACRMIRMGDGQHDHTAAALASRGVAAAGVVTEPLKSGSGEVTFIPNNEDD